MPKNALLKNDLNPLSTFSIVAYDPEAKEWGVAVQSRFLAVGWVVPWAKAGVGAVATQARANPTYGPRGLELLASGLGAEEVVARLTGEDPEASVRQLGIVDAQGRAAAFTGEKCLEWAGQVTGSNYTCQGNILVSEATVRAMAEAFENASGPLADRLVRALAAGQAAGGDRRGQQSAALLVVKEKGGYGGLNDRFIDLRVDDHVDPIGELARLLGLFKVVWFLTEPGQRVPLDASTTRSLQFHLNRLGYYQGEVNGLLDASTLDGLAAFARDENLSELWRNDGYVDGLLWRRLGRKEKS